MTGEKIVKIENKEVVFSAQNPHFVNPLLIDFTLSPYANRKSFDETQQETAFISPPTNILLILLLYFCCALKQF